MTNVTFFINIVYVKNTEFNFIWPNKDRFQLTSIYQMTDIKLHIFHALREPFQIQQ